MTDRPTLAGALLAVGLLAAAAHGAGADGGAYRGYAQVLSVTPVVEQVRVPVSRSECPAPGAPRLRVAPPELSPAPSLAQDMRRQQRLGAAPSPACRERPAHETRERILGYQVRYRYAGHEAVRRMARPPGEHLPVQVSVQPLP